MMTNEAAIETLTSMAARLRARATGALDLPKNAPKSKRANAELLATLLREEADALDVALAALKGAC